MEVIVQLAKQASQERALGVKEALEIKDQWALKARGMRAKEAVAGIEGKDPEKKN